jgi:hypothetical protein
MRRLMALALLLLTSAGPCAPAAPPDSNETLTIRGRLTTEGVECPAMRDGHGVLYTLAGSIGDFHAGDSVCVRGRRAEMSTCMQGITLNVEWVRPAGECP